MNDLTASHVEVSYDACREIARRSRSNFYPCFMLLPRQKRRAMHALYAFMRHTDDLGDNDAAAEKRQQALHAWRQRLEEALASEDVAPSTPDNDSTGEASTVETTVNATADTAAGDKNTAKLILPALVDTVRQFQIPVEYLTAVIEGVEMDLAPQPYETFDDLAEYCRRVASAVGLACIYIWGFEGTAAIVAAEKCGLAMQLTNILRDLKEDADNGRIYLPTADFQSCGYTADELRRGETGIGFKRLVELEYNRAEGLYREGATLFDYLAPDGRRIFGMMMTVYYRLLQKIRRAGPAVLTARVRLSKCEKLRIATRWIFCRPRKLRL